MTKKDYIKVAEAFNNLFDSNIMDISTDSNFIAGMARGIVDSAEAMADVFAADNPRFNRNLFLTACGMSVSVRP